MRTLLDRLTDFFVGCGPIAVAWAIIAIVIGFPIKWLWNWIMPSLFGLPEISFWMALGLALLVSILFGGVIRINNKKE